VVQVHGALLNETTCINRIVEVRHTRNVLAQVRFLVDALGFECEAATVFDNLAVSHGTEVLR
jgi:hypothetical protein